MTAQLTRRTLLAALGANTAIAYSAFSDDLSEKKAFMQIATKEMQKPPVKIPPGYASTAYYVRIPVIRPFVDWDYYYLEGELLWLANKGQAFKGVIVPSGFVTDLASVPRMLWSVFPKTGRYAYAAIVHDFLYWDQTRPRAECDQILAAAMQDAKVDPRTITEFVLALKVAGDRAWVENAKAKAAGEKRVLAKFPEDPLISWDDWRKHPDVFM